MHHRLARAMLIAQILSADGIMTPQERAFLEAAMDALGLVLAEKARVRELEGWDEAASIVAAMSADAKQEFVDGLVGAIL
ncbi:MAG: hypothetical protein OEY14_16055, partial [Myxococcales bacterium]|nr:hypothetical protein [Myxococcales bacterium]